MSRSLSRLQAILLGVVVLGGLALGAAGLFAIGGRQGLFSDNFQVQVGFPHVKGVEVGTRVRLRGLDAGEVTAINDADTFWMLELRVDGRFRQKLRTNASAQIVSEGMIGGKVIEIDPGDKSAPPVPDRGIIAARPTPELTDMLAEVQGTLKDVRQGQGTIGKLMQDEEAYRELLELVRQGRGTLNSIQQDADALKSMPIVRGYVKDAHKLLVRPNCERNQKSFAEADLFEPGRAVLTADGKKKLNDIVPWLNDLKHKNSEVVVATYANPKAEPRTDPSVALTLTEQQSDAVVKYLKDYGKVQKMGWLSSRKVTPIGLGTNPPPQNDGDKLPARVEVLVFVPQG